MHHSECRPIPVSKEYKSRSKQHVLLKISILNLSRKITLKTTLWCYFDSHFRNRLSNCTAFKIKQHLSDTFVHFNLNSTVLANRNNTHINSPGFESTQPINNMIKIRNLVLSSIWTRLNFFGLGGVYNAYIHSKPVFLGFLKCIKG